MKAKWTDTTSTLEKRCSLTEHQEQTERAKWLLENARFAAMATVNEDGSPHNTPYLFMKSDDLKEMYWGASPKSVHSKNIERTGQVFIVLYEASEKGGLYIRCKGARIADGSELTRALQSHNKIRKKFKKEPLKQSYYENSTEQHMYIADVEAFWVNYEDRRPDGYLREDKRRKIIRERLLS